MSYTARVYYVLESDVSYTLKYDTPGKDVNIGDSFSLSFLDFDYNGKHYYVKYAINNGTVYKRGVNTIDCKSMMISDNESYMNWFVFCTEDESEITGDCIVSAEDIASEIFLTIDGSTLSTQGSEYINSIDIMQGCVSDSFASYGSTYSPTINCDMFSCEFTDALISKAYVNDVIHCTLIRAWMVIKGHEYNPIPIGRFAVKENPTYNGETVSFAGNGLMSEYMDIAEISISSLNEYHKADLEKKYVATGKMDFIYTGDDLYFWEYLPQDFLRVTGCPLYIDNWTDVLYNMGVYGLEQLMIPMVSNASYDDENGYDISWETRITWRDLLSGIAVILRANVIEKNGAFYIKQLPQLQTSGTYRPIFDGNSYDSSAIFGNNLMCPNNISVKANNWYFYKPNNTVVGFGYYEGESTVVLNDKVSEVSNVENYPVTIESPWILYETLDRHDLGNTYCYPWFGYTGSRYWRDGLQFLNNAFVYHKASIETMYWHPFMSVGEILTFEDHDGVKKYVLVGEMTLHYNGTVYAEIMSPCEVQETNTSSVGGGGSTSYNSGTTAQASGTAMSTILGAIFKDGVITNSKIADSTITGSKIAESTIDNSNIKDSTITGSKFEDGTIENSKIKDSTLTGAKIADATIGFEKVNTSFIEDLTADKAYIDNLTARIGDFGFITADSADLKYATIELLQATDGRIDTLESKAITTDNLEAEVATLGYLSAESADVKFATIESLKAVDGKIDTLSSKAITTENLSAEVAELGYLSAESAEVGYAKIDFSNVGTQVVSSSMIIDGAVTNEKVANLSANKITSGTIDASKITVTNLNADNLTVGTINGKLIGNGSVDLDKLAEEVPTKEYLDNVQKDLQGQIDGAIETFTKSEIPTLNNEPASLWTDNETRKKHIGDVCYVLNPASSADGYCYRFANTGTEESPQYEWVLIKDSDVTKALQDIIDINGDIDRIKQFDEDISSWKNDTDEELSSLKLRTTTLETDMGSKVESSVFNEVKQTVDENSSSIASLSTTVSKKADGSTVETLTNTVNEVKQTADSNSLSISGMQTEISKKADGSTVTELSAKTSKLEQNLDGFKTEVSKTYTTKTEFESVDNKLTTNLLKPTLKTTTQNGVTCTNNGDGTYTLNGTASKETAFWILKNFDLNEGNYNLLGCPTGGSQSTYLLQLYDSGEPVLNILEKGLGKIFTLDKKTNIDGFIIRVYAGQTCDNIVFKPMITTNLNATYDDFVPYTGSTGSLNGDLANNHKLTENVKTIAEQTADKFSWLVKSGTSATNFELTDRTATLVANHINLNGLVTFSGLNSDAQNKINSAESTANNANTKAQGIIDNIYTTNTTTIDGGKITTGSIKAAQISSGIITTDKLGANAVTAEKLDVENIFADEAVLKELFAQDITATGTITGATLKGAHVESTSGSIGGFDIGEGSLSLSGTDGDSTFYTGLMNKTLNGDAFGALTSYWKISKAGTWYGGYVQISHGGLEAGRIGGVSPIYTPTFSITNQGDVYLSEINGTELAEDGIASTSEYGVTKKRTYKCLYISSPSSATSISSIVQGDYNEMIVEVEAYVNSKYIAYSIPIPISAVSSLTSYKEWIVGYSAGSSYWGYAEIYANKDSIYLYNLYFSSKNYKSSAVMRVYYC